MSRSHPDNIVQKRQRRARLLHSVYTWHRWLGLSVLLWALTWAVTGLLIEASPALGLDKKTISAHWLTARYGINAPTAIKQWQVDGYHVNEWDQGITLNGEWLTQLNDEPIAGVARYDGMLLIAQAKHITLLTPQAELIDTVMPPVDAISQIATNEASVFIQSATQTLSSSGDLLNWQPNKPAENWSIAAANITANTPKALHDISYERVILDIHSGTLFGPIGRWLSRLAAVVMILLGLTGFYTWFTRFARS